jgi:hypothetical protein
MSETFWCFMGLGAITTLQFYFIIRRLDELENKINALKGEK